MPQRSGPPSRYAESMRSTVMAVLIAQTVFCVLRMFMFLDIMGGFIMAIMVGLGWYAWKEDMNITFICYWGMMSLINGTFDLVKLIDHAVKTDESMFSREDTFAHNLRS